MNIFILDEDPIKAAKFHHNVHLVKMITETFQILSTVIWQKDCLFAEGYYGKDRLFAPSHAKHPCVVWVGESAENFTWLVNFSYFLNEEFLDRRNKHHGSFLKCFRTVDIWWTTRMDDCQWERIVQTPFVQCIPDKYKQNDPVKAYRNYYQNEKMYDKNGKSMADWGNRGVPYWILKYEA